MKTAIYINLFLALSLSVHCGISPGSADVASPEANKAVTVPPPVARNRDLNSTILPGTSVGNIYLRDTIDKVEELLGYESTDHIYDFSGCTHRVTNWVVDKSDMNSDLLEVIFDSQDKAVRLKIAAINFSTVEGISNGDELAVVKRKYADVNNIEAFLDLGLIATNNRYTTGLSAYWVDQSAGIAFEFVKVKKDNKWVIESISVFDPKEKFHRSYCDSEDTYWVKLNSLDLDDAKIDEIERKNTR